jgi:cytoskeletal protein CcmA (bactofilin family)
MAVARSTTTAGRHGANPASLGAGTRVRGRVTGDGDLVIHGRVEGEVRLSGALFIAEGASVVSDIDASELKVAGTLEGDVNVRGDVVILAGAKVRGDLKGASVSLEEGADFTGQLDSDFSLPSELTRGGSESAARPTRRR